MPLRTLLTYLLLLVALLQIFGKASNDDRLLRTAGYATAASPLPEVFGAMQGHDPIGTSYQITAHYSDGSTETIAEDQKLLAARLQKEAAHITRFGPYLLSIIWGMQFNPKVRDAVLRHGLCNQGPFAQIIGITKAVRLFTVTYHSRTQSEAHHTSPSFEVRC